VFYEFSVRRFSGQKELTGGKDIKHSDFFVIKEKEERETVLTEGINR